MSRNSDGELSRRERQIMDTVYARGAASAEEVREALPNAPGNSSVRTMLGILVEKGLLKVGKEGPRFIYRPAQSRSAVGRSAIRRVIDTFFEGSLESAVAAALDSASGRLSGTEIARLKKLIEESAQERSQK